MGATAPLPTGGPTRVKDMTKDDVRAIENAVKQAITPIVRELGGNESNGGALLQFKQCPTHKSKCFCVELYQ